MSKFLLAWELGGGLGHAGRLKPIAQGLLSRGHELTMWLRELVQTSRVLHDLPAPRLQAPLWQHQTMGVPTPQASLPEILQTVGYLQADHLQALVQGWVDAIKLCQPQALLVDFAPTALIAARIAGVPAASIGMGFWLPPAQVPIPAFRDWEPLAKGRVEHAENLVLNNVNTVLQKHGAKPFDALWQVFRGDQMLMCSWPEIDHYQRPASEAVEWLGPNILPEAGLPPTWPAGDGPRSFAYIKAAHPDHAPLLQALVALGHRVLCYLPEVCAGMKSPVVHPHIHYAAGPVDLGQTMAQSDLAICHAGQSTVAQALLAAVPLLVLPMQAEQFLVSRQLERHGVGLNVATRPRPANFKTMVQQVMQEPQWRAAAQAVAQRYASFSHTAQVALVLERLEALAIQP